SSSPAIVPSWRTAGSNFARRIRWAAEASDGWANASPRPGRTSVPPPGRTDACHFDPHLWAREPGHGRGSGPGGPAPSLAAVAVSGDTGQSASLVGARRPQQSARSASPPYRTTTQGTRTEPPAED